MRARSKAMTLIEVVVGMAILGTLLASLVVVRGRYLRQWALAGRRQQAVVDADSLLTDWWRDGASLPRNGSGTLRWDGMTWRTHVILSTGANSLGAQIVRLEVFEQKYAGPEPMAKPLAMVDIVLNRPLPETREEAR